MNALQKTLAIIAFVVLVSQSVRHSYLRWLEPRTSVLDKYDAPLKDEIAGAASLDELLRRYEAVRKEADAARAELKKSGKEPTYSDLAQAEPYKSERALHEAITGWESKAKELHELRFYWTVGLVVCLLGLAAFRKMNRWLGLSLVITGFSEIIYWTSPVFLGPNTREFDRLLVSKLLLSVISIVLLLLAIRWQGVFAEKQKTAG